MSLQARASAWNCNRLRIVMSKKLFIAEKPSVAREFANALKEKFRKADGFMESDSYVVTWCVGHLVTMSYPEVYDEKFKRWSYDTLPFIPEEYRYEVIPDSAKQFATVKRLLNREDVLCIYICTDSGREGEYIYRLVDTMAGVPAGKERRRVWIDSQTEEEVLRGIREAKLWDEYDSLSDAAYLRAQMDFLMGINFSRVLTLKYGNTIKDFFRTDRRNAISVGRVMTCVQGMVVRREREIRSFQKTPFYRVLAGFLPEGGKFFGEFRAVEGSRYFGTPVMYKENGFKEEETARALIASLEKSGRRDDSGNLLASISSVEKKKEKKNPPLLFNLAELQNECSKYFKISPEKTLEIVQELYEKKLVTYPRTDARVLSTAVAKEISKNLSGLTRLPGAGEFAAQILSEKSYEGISKTRYTNDKLITDHYAIIPTGQGLSALKGLSSLSQKVYSKIVRRFLGIFFPPSVYRKVAIVMSIEDESFFASFKVLEDEGWLKAAGQVKKQEDDEPSVGASGTSPQADGENDGSGTVPGDEEELELGPEFMEKLEKLKKGMDLPVSGFFVKEGETSPPKRYNSGSLILAMENAGQLIEDEELRAQIKGSGIGTSATRAEILSKLVRIDYLKLNGKTQIITPTLTGEMVFDIVEASIRSLLSPELTASWEKGLSYVTEGTITKKEADEKLNSYVRKWTGAVMGLTNERLLINCFNNDARAYRKQAGRQL